MIPVIKGSEYLYVNRSFLFNFHLDFLAIIAGINEKVSQIGIRKYTGVLSFKINNPIINIIIGAKRFNLLGHFSFEHTFFFLTIFTS